MRLAAAVCLTLSMAGPCRAADLENLYLTSQWFRLRDALAAAKTTDFYRGAMAAVFNDPATAERYLNAAMKSDPEPVQRVEAGALLAEMYAQTGRRKAARAQLEKLDSLLGSLVNAQTVERSTKRFLRTIRAELTALYGSPDQTVVARGLSRISYFQIDNMIVLPLALNGAPANYYLDTGSSENFLSQAEAKRLGLTVIPTSVPVETYGGHEDVVATGVAVAHDLVIGNVHLRDAAFVVTNKDDGIDGILGLPLMLALQTLRWNSDGTIEFGFPSQPRNLSEANLCFDDGGLVTEVGYGAEKLSLFVDTGTYETLLFPTFTHQFAKTVADTGTPEAVFYSAANFDSGARTLPELTLHVGGTDVTAGRIHALSRSFTESGTWAYGNLGNDFAGNARSVTLDFPAMRLTVEKRPASAGSATSCSLPEDFACLSGFACTVSYSPDIRCHVDRIPVEAPAGNTFIVPHTPDPSSSCKLPANFVCASHEICTAVFDGKDGCRIDHAAAAAPAPHPATEIVSAAVAAQPPAHPDARQIMERCLKFDSLAFEPAKDYVFTETSATKVLDADGSPAKVTVETKEVMTLYDQQYERLILKDGKPLSAKKERAEQARFDKAVEKRSHETPAGKARREDSARKQAAEDLRCNNEFLKLFTFSEVGTDEVLGRSAWIVEGKLAPGASPACDGNKLLAKFHFRIWIDRAEYRMARFQGDNIAPVTFRKVLTRAPVGGVNFTFQQVHLKDGVWMDASMDVRYDLRLMAFAKARFEVTETYTNFRKFQSDSQIVPVSEAK